jgi:hypothetical protein
LIKCPCCGYKTLTEEGGFEICDLCNWEDEELGRITPPDKVIGEANQDYSLCEARSNFKKYYTMYRQDNPTEYFEEKKLEIELKKKIMQVFKNLEKAQSHDDVLKWVYELESRREELFYVVHGHNQWDKMFQIDT